MNGQRSLAATSNRILTDVPCEVCHDHSSGKHYGIFACDGCAGFFKRSIRRDRQYICKNQGLGKCPVDKMHRNQCRSCRLQRCLESGMNKEAVQHERGPRTSTIRKQMALLLKESNEYLPNYYLHPLSLYQPSMIKSTPIDHHETAARTLFNAIDWIKSVPAFFSLSNTDQLYLLENTWRDLFLLTAIEQQWTFNITTFDNYHMHKSELHYFQEILNQCKTLQIDSTEMICLKSFVLFQTGISTSIDSLTIGSLQKQAQLFLQTYIEKQYPTEAHRFQQLLAMLTSFRCLPSSTIEEIFFRKTIGDQIEMKQLVKEMFKMIVQN